MKKLREKVHLRINLKTDKILTLVVYDITYFLVRFYASQDSFFVGVSYVRVIRSFFMFQCYPYAVLPTTSMQVIIKAFFLVATELWRNVGNSLRMWILIWHLFSAMWSPVLFAFLPCESPAWSFEAHDCCTI